jgi:hypothetical protein
LIKKNLNTIAVFVGITVVYLAMPWFLQSVGLVQLNVTIVEVNSVDASDVTFTVSMRNVSPWPIAFENMHMTVTANGREVQWSLSTYGSETPIIRPNFTLLPFFTTEGRYFVKIMSLVAISEPILCIGVTVTGIMKVCF